ncbi:MAG: AraC family transcriptional regulator [Lachnospiraceae bacterium]
MKYLKYKEHASRGTFDFPLEFYHIRPGHPRYEMSYHWHTDFELIRVLSGTFLLHLEGSEFLLHEGDVAFIHDGMLHGGHPNNCIYECIVFDLRLLLKSSYTIQKYLNGIADQKLILHTFYPNPGSSYQFSDAKNIRIHQELHKILYVLFYSMQQKSLGYELIVIGSLYHFFGSIIENNLYQDNPESSNILDRNKLQPIKDVLALIESDYGNELTLTDLSKKANMSPKYFCRFFHEMTQRTPIDYLNYYRIECACIELVTSGKSITEVAYSCGFSNLSYFIRTFKKYKGITPHKYLKEPISI